MALVLFPRGWKDAMEDLQSWLEWVNTDPDLMDYVITGLISGREGTKTHNTSCH